MLDAAEHLVRHNGGTDFSMRALASVAEVSLATPYNFFGSKEGLLFELLTRNLKMFMEEALVYTSDDPLAQVIEAADNAVTILLRDPVFLRPMYQVLLGLTDPLHHPKYLKDTFVFYREALNGAVKHKLLTSEQQSRTLACSLMAHFMGLLDLWVHEDIDDEWFRAQIIYGFIHHLLPLAKGQRLTMLKKKLASVNKVLSNPKLQPAFFSK